MTGVQGVPEGLYAVVVNYRCPILSANCARQASAAGVVPEQVVVVDNDAAPRRSRLLRRLLPRARVIEQIGNVGFARGCNIGVGRALALGAEAVLIVNPDAIFGAELIAALAADCDLRAACCGPDVFRARSPHEPWFSGAWDGRIAGTFRYRSPGDADRSVDYLWACCLLVGRDVWRRVGPFDERYFMYYEDMDWCRRAGRAGVARRIAPSARMWHGVGACIGGADSALRRYHVTRSSVLFHATSDSGRSPAARIVRLGSIVRTTTRLLRRADVEGLTAHVQGLRDGMRLARGRPGTMTVDPDGEWWSAQERCGDPRQA